MKKLLKYLSIGLIVLASVLAFQTKEVKAEEYYTVTYNGDTLVWVGDMPDQILPGDHVEIKNTSGSTAVVRWGNEGIGNIANGSYTNWVNNSIKPCVISPRTDGYIIIQFVGNVNYYDEGGKTFSGENRDYLDDYVLSYDDMLNNMFMPDDGYRSDATFLGWYTNAECTEKAVPIKYDTLVDLSYYAKWEKPDVKITNVSLDKKSVILKKGESTALTVKILPSNATNKTIEWTSSDTKVATVDKDGKVVAVASGECTVTAMTKDGSGCKATCKIIIPQNEGVPKFSDVKYDKWMGAAIDYVASHGYMKGTNDGSTFGPDDPCTREMMVQILYNINGAPEPSGKCTFKDAKKGWYYKALAWGQCEGISSGKTDGTFGVGEEVTRQELAQFLYNYAKHSGYEMAEGADISGFPDVEEVSGWAVDSIKWAKASGVMDGKLKNGTKYLAPKGKATRAEVAQMIMNLMVKVAN